jgi:transcriptional regulator with XRE-family HTH domain
MIVNFQNAKLSELESMTGIPSEMWCRWFNGYYSISGKSLSKAANALGVSTSMLLDQIERRKSQKQPNTDA